MIRLERPELPSTHKLLTDGPVAVNSMIALWQADPQFTVEINEKLYKSCQPELKKMHHGKCCFCETNIDAGSYGDVEHFRPKKKVTGDASHRGYWWLAYSWENLLWSCKRCNTSHKRNHFPLEDIKKRAYSPNDKLNDEQPTLIDPSCEDPAQHIRFRAELAVGETPRGRETIRILGLNRDEPDPELGEALLERRRRLYESVRTTYRTLEALARLAILRDEPLNDVLVHVGLDAAWLENWQQLERSLRAPSAEYHAMLRQAFFDTFELNL